MVIEIRKRLRLLTLLPKVGHPRPDLVDDPAVRFWSVYSYLVAFLPDQRPLFIVRILHGSRSPDDLREELRGPDDTEKGATSP